MITLPRPLLTAVLIAAGAAGLLGHRSGPAFPAVRSAAPRDAQSQAQSPALRQVSAPLLGRGPVNSWAVSPAGDRVVYWRTTRWGYALDEAPVAGGPARELYTSSKQSFGSSLLVSNDSRRAVVAITLGLGAKEIVAVTLQADDPNPRTLLESGNQLSLTADGRWLLVVTGDPPDGELALKAVSLDGAPTRLLSPQGIGFSGQYRQSADAERVLFLGRSGALFSVPVAGGQPLALSGPLAGGEQITSFADSPADGSVIFVVVAADGTGALWRVPAAGGAKARLDDPAQSKSSVRDFVLAGEHLLYRSVDEREQPVDIAVWSVPLQGGPGLRLSGESDGLTLTSTYLATPDGRTALMHQQAWTAGGEPIGHSVLAVDLASGAGKRLGELPAWDAPNAYGGAGIVDLRSTPDSRTAVWVGKRQDNQLELVTADIATGQARVVDVGHALGNFPSADPSIAPHYVIGAGGTQLVYFNNHGDVPNTVDVKVAVIGADAGPRVLMVDKQTYSVPTFWPLQEEAAVVASVMSELDETELLRLPLDGSPPTRINATPEIVGQVQMAAFTGDGRTIAYGATQDRPQVDLYLAPAGGGAAVHVPFDPDQDAMLRDLLAAPQGTWLLATVERGSSFSSYFVDAANPVPMRQVSADGDPMIGLPTFSPDGGWLVYVGGPAGSRGLYSIAVAGGSPLRIADQGDASAIQISSDSRHVIYTSGFRAWWTPIDRAEARPLSEFGLLPTVGFSPDGRYALYVENQNSGQGPSDWRLVSLRLADHTRVTLSPRDPSAKDIRWAALPGSGMVVFSMAGALDSSARGADFFTVALAGGGATRLGTPLPKGSHVLFLDALPDGSGVVCVILDARERYVPHQLKLTHGELAPLGLVVEAPWTISELWVGGSGRQVVVRMKEKEWVSPPQPTLTRLVSLDLATGVGVTLSSESVFPGTAYLPSGAPARDVQLSPDGQWFVYFEGLEPGGGARQAVFHWLADPWYRLRFALPEGTEPITTFDGHTPVLLDPTGRQALLIGAFESQGRELFALALEPPTGPRPTPAAWVALPRVLRGR